MLVFLLKTLLTLSALSSYASVSGSSSLTSFSNSLSKESSLSLASSTTWKMFPFPIKQDMNFPSIQEAHEQILTFDWIDPLGK